jgi:hypothetical protein
VDRLNGIVTLEVGETKNDDARTVYLDDELKETFNQQWEAYLKSLAGTISGTIRDFHEKRS